MMKQIINLSVMDGSTQEMYSLGMKMGIIFLLTEKRI